MLFCCRLVGMLALLQKSSVYIHAGSYTWITQRLAAWIELTRTRNV